MKSVFQEIRCFIYDAVHPKNRAEFRAHVCCRENVCTFLLSIKCICVELYKVVRELGNMFVISAIFHPLVTECHHQYSYDLVPL